MNSENGYQEDSSEVYFSDAQLMNTARQIAHRQIYTLSPRLIRPVKPQLEVTSRRLQEAYKLFSDAVRTEQEVSPAAEWVIDNFYIIQEQIVQVQSDFPIEYQKSIPVLTSGEFQGLPRVYELMQHLVLHTDNIVERDMMVDYVQYYQEEETLSLGEVWTIPIMIRLVLLDQLRNRVERIILGKKLQRKLAQLTEELGSLYEREGDPVAVINGLSEWYLNDESADGIKNLTILYQQLQRNDLLFEEVRQWFKGRFRRQDITLEEALNLEAQRHSRLQVSVQNAVVSLRLLSETEWKDVIEICSRTEQILRLDPAGIYSEMDFRTRDHYRKVVERLARYSDYAETEVAETVLLMAEQNEEQASHYPGCMQSLLEDRSSLKSHVGYYLMDDGYRSLTKKVGYRMPLRERITRRFESSIFWYFSFLSMGTILLLSILWMVTGTAGYPAALSAVLLLIALFPALELSVSTVNRFFAFFLSPRILSRMNFKHRIPDEARTLVVVPTMLVSKGDIRRQIENLEIRSLANPNDGLQFALLADFRDASDQQVEEDRELLETASKLIDDLNRKTGSRYGKRYFLLHRERFWNEQEGVWMGWERKRGKLEELNRLLADPNAKTSYSYVTEGFLESISDMPVRFVITLDADTKLPPESALDLIRTIAHPLNRAHRDQESGKVIRGYGIIQPRISIPPESARTSWFSRIFSGNVGIDAYSTVVSDIYQDLSGEAVFIGKGIYDAEAFHRVLEHRFPENRILSHDLIESNYLRAGLATTVELFDDFPSRYTSYSKRNHRWTRGDWQIASWCLPRVPTPEGKKRNPLNGLSRWKILDNLRRSLNPFFLMLFFLSGWFWLPGSAWIWTLAAFGILAFPIYVTLSTDLLNRPARVKWKLYMEKVLANLNIHSAQVISVLTFLPHQAVVQLDAIIRVFWRLLISGRHLLEWTTASQVEKEAPDSFRAYLQGMIVSPIIGLAIPLAGLVIGAASLWILTPFSLLWILSPWVAWRLSQTVEAEEVNFTEEQERRVRSYARRTWAYFERFLDEEFSWLPPDNYQESPPLKPTPRTSPTNIGLALHSIQSAYNMGYIPFGEYLERLERTVESMTKLELFRGHFYNWYDLRTGETLPPNYISTVDSGNLAAALIVISQGVKHELQSSGLNRSAMQGLGDTMHTLRDLFTELKPESPERKRLFDLVCESTGRVLARIDETDDGSSREVLSMMESVRGELERLARLDLEPTQWQRDEEQVDVLQFWLNRPLQQLDRHLAEFRLMTEVAEGSEVHRLNALQLARLSIGRNGNGQLPDETAVRPDTWPERVERLAERCSQLVEQMDFSFLYDRDRGLFYIGYDVSTSSPDRSTYDLLASEARIASFIAISRGQVPPEHWFRLSRRLTSLKRGELLLSWGGTMFEYLMPLIYMRSYPHTMLSHTYDRVVQWQKEYGDRRGHPWGSSESAYFFLNLEMHYQYKAFGVPGLGMKRGLAEEYVIAPYASMLALMVDPVAGIENLKRIESVGGLGLLGFYDAIDYTPARLKEEETHKVVRSYMAHHHGMGLAAIDNVLNGWKAHHFFHSDLQIRGCELMLQERIPRGVPVKEPHPIDVELEPGQQEGVQISVAHRGIDRLDESPPRLHLLSNGSYSVLTSHNGSGVSTYHDLVLGDWKPDLSGTSSGLFFYVRDLETGEYWSSSHQPVRRKPDRYDSWFHNDRIVTSRVDEWIETTTEICVSPEYNFELRRVTLTNYADRERSVDLTSFMDVALNRQQDHQAHPAFSRLFLQSEYLPQQHALLVKRRPRGRDEEPVWLIHTMTGPDHENVSEPLQYETDKEAFLGRGCSLASPTAMTGNERLEGRLGNVINPIVSLRRTFRMNAGEKVQFTYGLGIAFSREEAVRLADIFQSHHATDRAFELAMVYSRVELDHIGADSKQAQRFQKMMGSLIYSDRDSRPDEHVLRSNQKTQRGLWPYGISGDLPILLVKVRELEQIKYVSSFLKAHSFWRHKGFKTDLVLVNHDPPTYADDLQEALLHQVERYSDSQWLQRKGGIYLIRAEDLLDEDLTLLQSVAHLVTEASAFHRSLPDTKVSETRSWTTAVRSRFRSGAETSRQVSGDRSAAMTTGSDLSGREDKGQDGVMEYAETEKRLDNGYGGFSPDGKEYIIDIPLTDDGEHRYPPAPWGNVFANTSFGAFVTERGSGYTWSGNSRENKLTVWSNEPVADPHSEAVYLRDEQTGEFWTPLPGPVPGAGSYRVTHGFGYSCFDHESNGLKQQVLQFVARNEPVKLIRVQLENKSDVRRELSLYGYLEWVLGDERRKTVRHLTIDLSGDKSRHYITNAYREEYQSRVAFAAMVPLDRISCENTSTGDRSAFIGLNRTAGDPQALIEGGPLDDNPMIGGDPCSAFRAGFSLSPGEKNTLLLLVGEAESREEADRILDVFSSRDAVNSEYRQVTRYWERMLGRIRVDLPDETLSILMNGWLLYQTICCRIWARTAFYQAGGAFGFRDQLQDAMAAFYADPGMCREQILLHAEHQFPEGDALHWWHPPTSRGIRSKISDDRLWLPYVTLFYLESTGDSSILQQQVSYLQARKLEPEEHEVYLHPTVSDEKGSIYEHCCRAIDVSLAFGERGLPLIGAGDWNDGMNRIGIEGKGESVWLGFFLVTILEDFIPIAEQEGDTERAERYRRAKEDLHEQLNLGGWDGEWYLRAYFDDGTPVGSASSEQCRIDAISQAWSVLSGVAPPERAKMALDSAVEMLVDEQEQIIRLLTPPFDINGKDPGYIQGYVPGVRENGGQYTHAALWLIMALAESGRGEEAVRYLKMISPTEHARDRQAADRYRVEPYVVAADVYGQLPLTGRGGWSWYTGSAGWMYRTVLESVLGIRRRKNELEIKPSVSGEWPSYQIELLLEDDRTKYEITVENPDALQEGGLVGTLDGESVDSLDGLLTIPLTRDGEVHRLRVELVPEENLSTTADPGRRRRE